VTVRHGNGVETRYAHLSATTVKAGDHVDAGQQIGNVGTTGYSTGPHLHFEVRKDGQAIDPAPFLPINTPPTRPKP
jgi:murein DD-endopeptidase MepM/ murein hydrolase activator NlpD